MITQLEYGIHNLRAVYMYYRVILTEYTLYRFVAIFVNSRNLVADRTKFHVDITQSWSVLTNIYWFDLLYWWVSHTGFEVWFYVRTIYDAFNPYDAIFRSKNWYVTKKGWVSMLNSSPSKFPFIWVLSPFQNYDFASLQISWLYFAPKLFLCLYQG